MSSYSADYVAVAAPACGRTLRRSRRGGSPAALEDVLFRMLLALDASFAHPTRAVEGRDGNPLNEVRVLCNSVLLHDGVMTAEKGIKLDPATSVAGVPYGERIALGAESFSRLADAFFDELEREFVAS